MNTGDGQNRVMTGIRVEVLNVSVSDRVTVSECWVVELVEVVVDMVSVWMVVAALAEGVLQLARERGILSDSEMR